MRKFRPKRPQKLTYPRLLLKLTPLLIFFPIFVDLVGDFNGRSVEAAFHQSVGLLESPVLWACAIAFAAIVLWFLNPITRFFCVCGQPEACSPEDADRVIRRVNHLHLFVIAVSILVFSLGEIIAQFHDGASALGNIARRFLFMDAWAKGLLTGVIVSFNLDNMLFAAKKAALDMNPQTPLRRTSLYGKIFLIIISLVLYLLFQLITTSANFFDLGSALYDETPKVSGIEHFFGEALKAPEMKSSVRVISLKMLLYLFFVFQLMRQIKLMIRYPINGIRSRLRLLNAGEVAAVKSVDILSNDEFTDALREINTLIARQQAELADSSDRLESIVERAPDPIVSYDKDGKILTFNPAAEQFFGYSGDEARALALRDLVEPYQGTERASNQELTRLLAGTETSLARLSGIHRDGRRLALESNSSCVGSGDSVIHTAILRDVSRQLEFEENLTRAKVAAENANRLKTEFLANMSHELRTPLNAVLGFTQLMAGDKNLTPGQVEKIAIISRSGEHLLSLINDILDISKIEAGKQDVHLSAFDLDRFVDDIREMFSLRCQKAGLALFVEKTGPLPNRVRGDLGKLRQVMINLVGNAVKFTHEGGIGITVGQDGGKIRFSVTDSGKGIPKDELELIMQPFIQSSLTDHEGGTGLGLAISSRYVAMMGGKISVTSEVGKGSTFTFAIDLPETDERLPDSVDEKGAIALKKGSSALVLIVDDKELNRLVLKEMLEAAGFATMEAENGKVAIERSREFKPRIVFMDIKMPVMDGYEAVKGLKEDGETSAIPVFALTASAFTNDEERILASGFDGFLAKPFKRSSLFRLIREKSGVELEYETAEIHATESIPDPESVDYAKAAKALGAEIDEIAEAIAINDFTAIKRIAERHRQEAPELAALLSYHAEGFDEAALEKIVGRLRA